MWILLALASALFQVLRNTVMKRLGHSLDEYINVWGRFTFLLPFALILALAHGLPSIQPGFVSICLLFGLCQTVSTLALSKALKLSQISLVTALWKLSLPILLLMGFLTLKETPTPIGIAGVLLSAAGVYLLNVSHARLSPWAPLTILFRDPGLRYTLLSALFFAPSVVTIKQAILLSDPYTGTFGGYLAACLWVTPLVLVTSRSQFAQVPRHWKEFAGLGLFAALTTVSQGVAYTLTLSSYVEAVKQVEILLALLIGGLAFGERQTAREIAPGACVMLAGMVLLSLAG
ncbi:MAG TPA: EamA family transporter [Candidatus Methylomirabilis sp.]|nr:EamA family transporter [Candidatus Methylomirabilis sp.]